MKLIQKIIIVYALVWCAAVSAQTCKNTIALTTPDGRFIDNGDGTVKDKKTRLIWMRCSLGQTWDGQTCNGDALAFTWQKAMQEAEVLYYAGSSDWRLPNTNELGSIVERACHDPAINQTVFPSTSSAGFVTSSREIGANTYVWYIAFDIGRDFATNITRDFFVRLVRTENN